MAEILEELERPESEFQNIDTIYIQPPDADILSDEDSGDEDGGMLDNLSRRQLAVPAEVVFSNDVRLGAEEEDFESSEATLPETSLPVPLLTEASPIVTTESPTPTSSTSGSISSAPTVRLSNEKRKWGKGKMKKFSVSFPESDYTRYRDFSPMQLFELFFDDEIYEMIVEETAKYAAFKNMPNPNVSKEELKCFVGIMLISGYNPLPGKRYYWDSGLDVRNQMIYDSMRRNRLQTIMSFVHFADSNNFVPNDKMWKLRPLIDKINKNMTDNFIPVQNINFDESMIAYYGHHGCKQFLRGKPIRFGFKAWCLNTFNGYLINFEIYQGKNIRGCSEYEKFFGKCAAPMVSMLMNLPQEKKLPYFVYFDNLFTGINLLEYLRQHNMYGTGTIRENRTPKECKLLPISLTKKKERGFFDHSKSSDDVSIVRWQDNSVVTVASTACSVDPVVSVRRYSQKEKRVVTVKQPNVVCEYNKFMGGTDLMDENINRHRISIRSKKWWWAIFSWCIDASIQNAWFLHNMSRRENKISQLEFKRAVATSYLKTYGVSAKHGGRPTARPQTIPAFINIRYDRIDHFIIQNDQNKRRRCAGRVCTSSIRTSCEKCNVGLCVPCFKVYHTPE